MLPKRSEMWRLQKTRKTTAEMGGLYGVERDLRKAEEEESGKKVPTTGNDGNK